MRLRGTVYRVVERDDNTTAVDRVVCDYDVLNADAFKAVAAGDAEPGVTLEFGPIAPPWRRLP